MSISQLHSLVEFCFYLLCFNAVVFKICICCFHLLNSMDQITSVLLQALGRGISAQKSIPNCCSQVLANMSLPSCLQGHGPFISGTILLVLPWGWAQSWLHHRLSACMCVHTGVSQLGGTRQAGLGGGSLGNREAAPVEISTGIGARWVKKRTHNW